MLNILLIQLHPNGWTILQAFWVICHMLRLKPSPQVFLNYYSTCPEKPMSWFSLFDHSKTCLNPSYMSNSMQTIVKLRLSFILWNQNHIILTCLNNIHKILHFCKLFIDKILFKKQNVEPNMIPNSKGICIRDLCIQILSCILCHINPWFYVLISVSMTSNCITN